MIPKFKIWNKNNFKMYEANEVDGIDYELGQVYIYDATDKERIVLFFDDCEFLQFTRLTDHNGVEIFEGDILKLNRDDVWYGHVQYFSNLDCPAFDVKPPNDYQYDCSIISHELACGLIEVVGNIYENPVYSTEDGII